MTTPIPLVIENVLVLDIFIAMFSHIQNLLSDGCLPSASKAAIIHIFVVASTSMSCFPLQNVMAFLLLCWAETLFFSGSGSHGIPKLCGVWRRLYKKLSPFCEFQIVFLGHQCVTEFSKSTISVHFQDFLFLTHACVCKGLCQHWIFTGAIRLNSESLFCRIFFDNQGLVTRLKWSS